MAYEYQTGEDRFSIGGVGEILPDELSARYFQNLDAALARAEKTQMDRTLGELEGRGFLRSGDTFSRVAQDVLGPSQERRDQILLPELRRASDAGREERLGAVQFGRQKEMAGLEHKYRLEEIEAQANVRRMLMELEDNLSNDGFDWGSIAGTVGGMAAGSFFGGAGASLGSKMFGSAAGAAGGGAGSSLAGLVSGAGQRYMAGNRR